MSKRLIKVVEKIDQQSNLSVRRWYDQTVIWIIFYSSLSSTKVLQRQQIVHKEHSITTLDSKHKMNVNNAHLECIVFLMASLIQLVNVTKDISVG